MSGCGGVGVSQARGTSRGLLISRGLEKGEEGRPVTSLIRSRCFGSAGLAGKRTPLRQEVERKMRRTRREDFYILYFNTVSQRGHQTSINRSHRLCPDANCYTFKIP